MSTTIYNPFGWRLAEIADASTGDLRRRDLVESLIIAEAEELARGRRHLTIVHGAPDTIADGATLDAFYDQLFALVEFAEWARVRGTEEFVTVTVGGAGAEQLLLQIVDVAHRADPGDWQVMDRPFPTVE
jgi:hypothetical protein